MRPPIRALDSSICRSSLAVRVPRCIVGAFGLLMLACGETGNSGHLDLDASAEPGSPRSGDASVAAPEVSAVSTDASMGTTGPGAQPVVDGGSSTGQSARDAGDTGVADATDSAPMADAGGSPRPGSSGCGLDPPANGDATIEVGGISQGKADPTVKVASGQAARDFWLQRNHCDASKSAPVPPAPTVEYGGCDPGFGVRYCEYEGEHNLPRYAPQGLWDFFKALP